MTNDSITTLLEEILRFRDERDWAQFHKLKDLAAAIAIEAGELQETMLWKAPEQVAEMLRGPDRHRIANEIADVLIYALLAAHEAGVSPSEAIRQKLAENAIKYPVAKSRGSAAKYTDLPK